MTVMNTLEASSDEEKGDYGMIKEKIRQDLKRFIVKNTSRRPLIMPVILEILTWSRSSRFKLPSLGYAVSQFARH